jgi:hypothetical protein
MATTNRAPDYSHDLPPPPEAEGELLIDVWRHLLGEVLGQQMKAWDNARELVEARAAAALANLKCELEQKIVERLATLRDGETVIGPPGRDGAQGPAGD